VETKIIEAVQSKTHSGNWGKFLVGVPDVEWARRSQVDTGFSGPLLSAIGWSRNHVWVLDLQTGEGAFPRPGGPASADLAKHRILACPLFDPFLGRLYERCRENGGLELNSLPGVVEFPSAEFSF
jgi:hypothetical protein